MSLSTLISRIGLTRLLIPACVFTVILFVFCLTCFHMNLFSVASLSVATLSALLAFIVSAFSTKRVHQIWAIFNVILVIWGLTSFLAGMSATPERALIFWRLSLFVCTFISVVYYQVIIEFCQIKRPRVLFFAYFQGVLFVPIIILSNNFIGSTFYAFGSIYYYKATFLFFIWSFLWFIITGAAFFELYKFIKISQGIQKTQALYMFWGMLLGHTGGASTILPAYSVLLYPVWHFSICVYAGLMTYAMFRYQLMDIRLAISNTAIFIGVYALVLGVPFYIFTLGDHLLALIFMLVLATAGPVMFNFLRRRAEERILKEEKKIQEIIIKASTGMVVIRDLQKLLKVSIDVLQKNLHLDNAAVYLFDPQERVYSLKASEPQTDTGIIIKQDDPLVERLKDKKFPILLDEMNHLLDNQKKGNGQVKDIVALMHKLSAAVVVPAIKEDHLLAFIVLGKRQGKEVYSPELLDILSVVGNEVALAAENAIFYEESGKDWTQRAHESRLRTMGAMGTGIAHQIRNRFNAISSQCLLLQDLLAGLDSAQSKPEDFAGLRDECNKTMERIFKDIEHGDEVVEAIKNYSKQTEAKPQVVVLDQTVSGAMRLLKLSRKHVSYTLVEDFDKGIMLWTNSSMLQDMFYNLLDNSNDAVMSKQEAIQNGRLENRNEDFKVIVSAKPNTTMCEIVIEDNGMGIKKEHLEEGVGVNVMYFTTKGATKGTGMGLALMRQFVKYNNGTMKIDSEYARWTRIAITLPLATQEQIQQDRDKNRGSA